MRILYTCLRPRPCLKKGLSPLAKGVVDDAISSGVTQISPYPGDHHLFGSGINHKQEYQRDDQRQVEYSVAENPYPVFAKSTSLLYSPNAEETKFQTGLV